MKGVEWTLSGHNLANLLRSLAASRQRRMFPHKSFFRSDSEEAGRFGAGGKLDFFERVCSGHGERPDYRAKKKSLQDSVGHKIKARGGENFFCNHSLGLFLSSVGNMSLAWAFNSISNLN